MLNKKSAQYRKYTYEKKTFLNKNFTQNNQAIEMPILELYVYYSRMWLECSYHSLGLVKKQCS